MAVVLTNGRVSRVWVGAFGLSGQQEVEAFFLVKLPGLRQLASDAKSP
jgi:hypothetical protein